MSVPRRIDVPRLVEDLGGPTVLHKKLYLIEDPAPEVSAIRKWVRRGSIPTRWLVVLMDLAKNEGRPINLETYLVRS